MKTIYIFGANGMLGRYVKYYLRQMKTYDVIPMTRKEVNINFCTLQQLENSIIDNSIIVNCAGKIPQSSTDNDDSYFMVNGLFPIMLGKTAQKKGCQFIHITTDCVYDGLGSGKYTENDFPTETNAYGRSKYLGEMCDATIIRTSIIGEELENKKSFLEFVRNSTQSIRGYKNHFWNGVTCLQLAQIIEHIIATESFWKGIRHIFTPYTYSKFDMACIIKDIYGLQVEIIPFETLTRIDKTLDSQYAQIMEIPDLLFQIRSQKDCTL